jgi:hypothetical protein
MRTENMNPNSDDIQWEDISKAASNMFRCWYGDGEIRWVKECWGHFQEAGLAGNATSLEGTASLLRLVCLARIYEEFSGLAWDENPDTPISYLTEDLTLDPVALGILGAQASPDAFDDLEDESELRDAAITAATDAQRSEISDCLAKAYGGDVQLYSRMYHTRGSDEDANDGYEFEVTGPNSVALSYVMNGFQQG